MRRQVFFVSLGGFDNHNLLMQDHPNLMQRVNDAMSAFYAATVELGVADKVTTFTASDFGRTLSSNADGSDHGWGSHHFVMGGAVQGRALLRHRAARVDPDRRPGGAGPVAAEHVGR